MCYLCFPDFVLSSECEMKLYSVYLSVFPFFFYHVIPHMAVMSALNAELGSVIEGT